MNSESSKRQTPWPWGRSSPEERVRDLRKLIQKNEAQIRIEEDRSKERIRRLQIKIDGYKSQLDFAETCFSEQIRAENKELAYQLELMGVPAIEDVNGAQDQKSLQSNLRERLKQARSGRRETNNNDEFDEFDDNSVETV